MKAGAYLRAETLQQALEALEKGGCMVLAGGTDVLVKARERDPYGEKTLLDIARVPELRGLNETEGTLEIGAAVTLSEILESEKVKRAAPLLWQAAFQVGSTQIRNRATLAGNVANACPAADCIPALLVLGAAVELQSTAGRRTVPVEQLFKACPACLRHAGMHVKTCFFADPMAQKLLLKPGELIVSIRVKKQQPEEKSLFYKLRQNANIGMAVMNLALAGKLDAQQRIVDVRASMGGLFAKPCLLESCVAPLIGRKLTEEALQACAAAAAERMDAGAKSLADFAYKRAVMPQLLTDGLRALFWNVPIDGEEEPI